MEELFDVFDRQGNFLGIKTKSFCHSQNPGVYHKPVWIWIVNDKGEILIQKRAKTKKWLPNKWDGSATGHVVAGETILQGCKREVFEELGISVNESEFEFIGEYIADSVWELGQIFKLRNNTDILNMKMQKEEVSDLKWVDFKNFKKIFYSEDFVPYDTDHKDMIFRHIESSLQNNN